MKLKLLFYHTDKTRPKVIYDKSSPVPRKQLKKSVKLVCRSILQTTKLSYFADPIHIQLRMALKKKTRNILNCFMKYVRLSHRLLNVSVCRNHDETTPAINAKINNSSYNFRQFVDFIIKLSRPPLSSLRLGRVNSMSSQDAYKSLQNINYLLLGVQFVCFGLAFPFASQHGIHPSETRRTWQD